MHILLATDADWIVDEVTAALGADDVTFTVCREGRVVADQVAERMPDVAIFDLQVGSMGGMAITMSLRLDESAGRMPHVPVLMLLDRRADLHLARRSGAEGWMIKPLDALRLKRAVRAVSRGDTFTEGLPHLEDRVGESMAVIPDADDASADEATGSAADPGAVELVDGESGPAEEEPANAG